MLGWSQPPEGHGFSHAATAKTSAPRILLTGVTGQVGGELKTTLAPLGEVITLPRDQMDLAQPGSVRAAIRSLRPDWIVNPAAYTAVDQAETEPERAYAINTHSVEVIGEEALSLGATVLHFSTDYVFPGEGTSPYRETDPTGPLSVYGASKLAGEQALAASGAPHIILRTSWVYGATGKNFLCTIVKLARERDTLRIVADQHGAPTWSRDLARLAAAILTHPDPVNLSGIYHAAAAGETTWHGFATEAVRQLRVAEPGFRFATLQPTASSEYPTLARRPANSRLDCTRLATTFGWTFPSWQQSLTSVVAELASSRGHA